jgi:hypothetical protein
MNTNLLNNIKVASPCSADWNAMIGNNRKRFCGDCKLNVYNLSDMPQADAENFLLASEGRVCVRFFRRTDGTVLTQDCPVGWAKVKRKISRTATAAFSLFAGLFGGLFAFGFFKKAEVQAIGQIEVAQTANVTVGTVSVEPNENVATMGGIESIREEKGEYEVGQTAIRKTTDESIVEGQIANIDEIRRQIKKQRKR